MSTTRVLRSTLATLWRADRLLTATGLFQLALLAVCVVGLLVDPRTVTGAPAWLKPAKFAVSSALFALTLAWYRGQLAVWPRFVAACSLAVGVVLTIEVPIILLQAMRGVRSHFNIATTQDMVLFNIMGVGIAVLWLASLGFAAALFRQRFADAAWGGTLRLAMTLTVLGAGAGGLMLGPTPEQRAAMQAHQRPSSVGGHTVGAPDGGEGLPVTNWSRRHGDLRVAHFMGLHAVQVLPLVALWVRSRRRWNHRQQLGLALTAAASYAGLFGLLLWQALRGQSIAGPDELTLLAAAGWLLATALAVALSLRAAPATPHMSATVPAR